MKIAIYGRTVLENKTACVQELFTELQKHNLGIFVHSSLLEYISGTILFSREVDVFHGHDDIRGKADFMICLGGDGTMLDALAFIRNSGIPVLGINTGRLGFLAGVAKDEVKEAVAALLNKNYSLDKRSLLKLTTRHDLFGPVNYALNELTVLKKDSSTMMTIHAYINGEFLNSYWADGLIISTPTGSTAYSLSCGGPIMVPDSKSFIITPISPHNLNVRPLIISDDSVLTLRVEGRSSEFLASLDSRTAVFPASEELTVTKEDFKFNLLKLKNTHFFNTIRNKLMWGLDKRN
ncbi:MAG TPA: NAD kinase [Bacteroidia bacterium]|jgi:NAD+ kinase|nr:NAD kinase [Bacteroidia bacterium]